MILTKQQIACFKDKIVQEKNTFSDFFIFWKIKPYQLKKKKQKIWNDSKRDYER